MPVCPKCRKWIETGNRCADCGDVIAEMTAIEPVLKTDPLPEVRRWQPVARPPMARLIAIDDDSIDTGQTWHIRSPEISIGRYGCDVSIAHDPDMSSRHASIARTQASDGSWRWNLVDLDSGNGTFIRVDRRTLIHEDVLRIGHQLFSLQGASEHSDARLIQRSPTSKTYRLRSARDVRIGSDSSDVEIHLNDATVDPQHAVLSCHHDQWTIRDHGSLNGLYVKMRECELAAVTRFLLGGQRFRFDPMISPPFESESS